MLIYQHFKEIIMSVPKSTYIMLGLGITILIIVIVGYLLWHKYWIATPTPESCSISSNCPTDSFCSNGGVCMTQQCSVNNDCGTLPGSICLGGFCMRASCRTSNDCFNIPGIPGNYICSDTKVCVPVVSAPCKNNTDCYGGELSCINGNCVACSSTGDCLPGEACVNGSCQFIRSANSQDCVGGTLVLVPGTVTSLNPELPMAFCCSGAGFGAPCSSTTTCPTGQFCVNGSCRCVAGQLFEACVNNSDCKSNNCINNMCGYVGTQCLTNYNPNTVSQGPLPCDTTNPYCVNGVCNNGSSGAFCSGSFNSTNVGLCYGNGIYVNNTSNTTNLQPNNTGRYCVNSRCSLLPGQLNQICATNTDCTFYNSVGGTGTNLQCINGRCAQNPLAV